MPPVVFMEQSSGNTKALTFSGQFVLSRGREKWTSFFSDDESERNFSSRNEELLFFLRMVFMAGLCSTG